MKVILASSSPSRKKLLSQIIKNFEIKPANIKEKIMHNENFVSACKRLAYDKARSIHYKNPQSIVIGADTIAYRGKKMYEKTDNEKTAIKNLMELSGKTHTVATGVAVLFPNGKKIIYHAKAKLKMKKMKESQIKKYIKSGKWKGKAGSYDISDESREFFSEIRGEKSAVIGLPLRRLKKILKKSEKSFI